MSFLPSHKQHSLCYTTSGALAGARNINKSHQLTHGMTSRHFTFHILFPLEYTEHILKDIIDLLLMY